MGVHTKWQYLVQLCPVLCSCMWTCPPIFILFLICLYSCSRLFLMLPIAFYRSLRWVMLLQQIKLVRLQPSLPPQPCSLPFSCTHCLSHIYIMWGKFLSPTLFFTMMQSHSQIIFWFHVLELASSYFTRVYQPWGHNPTWAHLECLVIDK